ncbi:MAG: ATP-binding protein [Actinomycetota bacterium]
MKLLTKFIWSSLALGGLTFCLSVGSELLLKKVDDSTEILHTKADRASQTVLALKVSLRDQLAALRNYIILKRQPSDMTNYYQKMSNFIMNLDELETLIPDKNKIAVVRRRHQFLIRLATDIQDTPALPERTYQDFLALNSFRKDIDFSLDTLIEQVNNQNALAKQEAQHLKQVVQIFRYTVTGVIVLVFVGQFVLILLPVIRAIEKLQLGAVKIGAGNWDYRLEIRTQDEIEQLADEFNQMAEKLAESYHLLEQKVIARTAELTATNQNLEKEVIERKQTEAELQQTLQRLQQTQAQLIQTEKMSSLGQLVAGVAHEINNPVNFIYGNTIHASDYIEELLNIVQLYQKYYPQPASEIQEAIENSELDFLMADLPKILSSIRLGADRIREIVLSLRNFSRLDESEMKAVNIHEGLDNTLLILQNRLKIKSANCAIEVIKQYGDLPLIECYAGQLNQVFMNLLTNAIDALECSLASDEISASERGNTPIKHEARPKKPTITISTQLIGKNNVLIQIADNADGMSEDVKKRIFDPFFTTKPVGKGTGLGLSISYQIVVEKHGGILRCESETGQGTEFSIKIPVQQTCPLTAALLV